MRQTWRVIMGDAIDGLRQLPDESVQCCVTSPPYWGLRDYGVDGQIGLETTPGEYVTRMVAVFAEVRRVLRNDGTLWLNVGDSYARDAGKGHHKPGDAGKQNYIIAQGGGRSAATYNFRSETLGSSDGFVGRGDRAATRNGALGIKPKDLIGIPWRLAFALRADGWYLRSDIIWHKPNPMPESVTDRPTKSHEYVFLLSKAARYYYDAEAVAEEADLSRAGKVERSFSTSNGGVTMRGDIGREVMRTETRNARTVWTIPTQGFPGAHFATFPEELPRQCIKAGSRPGDTILDPFTGSGTTGAVALQLGRSFVGTELNPEYRKMARERIGGTSPLLADEVGEPGGLPC